MEEIDLAETIVEKYNDKTVVNYLTRNFDLALKYLSEGVDEQHLGKIGSATQHLESTFIVLKRYNEKKNGKKGITVV